MTGLHRNDQSLRSQERGQGLGDDPQGGWVIWHQYYIIKLVKIDHHLWVKTFEKLSHEVSQ